jgi:hypothetical protein
MVFVNFVTQSNLLGKVLQVVVVDKSRCPPTAPELSAVLENSFSFKKDVTFHLRRGFNG